MSVSSLFCSTGTIVGRINGFNIHLVTEILPPLVEKEIIHGAELMMLPVYYDRLAEVSGEWLRAGIPLPIIHADKDIGTLFSDAGVAFAEGDRDTSEALCDKATEKFRRNCEMGALASSRSMVLHLWGGMNSDRQIEYNAALLEGLCGIIRPYNIRLLIENVPSNTYDPLSNWKKLLPLPDNCALIFDTRFGQLHRQIDEIWADNNIAPHIDHIHISDILGAPRDFSTLRPILHPGEGMIDFDNFRRILDAHKYSGTVTLESPVIRENGADGEKLVHTLRALRTLLF